MRYFLEDKNNSGTFESLEIVEGVLVEDVHLISHKNLLELWLHKVRSELP
jgi:hypothetical protein